MRLSATDRLLFARVPLRLVVRRGASFLAALCASAVADVAAGTTADNLCFPTADPCRVSAMINVTPGSEIDVGTRELLIANRGGLNLTSGTMTLTAHTLTVEAGGSITARGNANDPGGKIIAVADTISIAGTADASGGPGGTLTLTATGSLSVSGLLDVRSRSSGAGAGTLAVQGGTITIESGGHINAVGGADGFGGDITMRAAAAMVIGGDVNASGGDGGSIDLSASTTLTTGANVTLSANATSTAGGGGTIDLSALGAVAINGTLSADGRNGTEDTGGGDGGSISVEGSSIDVTASGIRLTAEGGSPDGIGGDIDLTSDSAGINIRGQLIVQSSGPDGNGGSITVDAAADATLAGTMDASAGGGGGGDVDISSGMNVTIPATGSITVAASGSGSGGGIDIAGGPTVAVTGALTTDGGSGPGAGGGTIDVSGCSVRIDAGARLSSLRASGRNTLVGRDAAVVSGTLRADPTTGRNVIRFAGTDYEPSILPGAQINPPVALVVDTSVVPCNPISTRTPTITPRTGTPSGTPPTPTRTPGTRCVGDCNGNGMVIVNELVLGVNVALGIQPVSSCSAFDASGDGAVTVNELVLGVGNALNGCPP